MFFFSLTRASFQFQITTKATTIERVIKVITRATKGTKAKDTKERKSSLGSQVVVLVAVVVEAGLVLAVVVVGTSSSHPCGIDLEANQYLNEVHAMFDVSVCPQHACMLVTVNLTVHFSFEEKNEFI